MNVSSFVEQAKVFANLWRAVDSAEDSQAAVTAAEAEKTKFAEMLLAMGLTTEACTECIELLQGYASAYSLIGSVFDKGEQVDLADEAFDELTECLEDYMGEGPTVDQLALIVSRWHAGRIAYLEEVVSNIKEGTEVKLEGSDQPSISLTAREALIFKLGFHSVLGSFATLPFGQKAQPAAKGEATDAEG